MDHAHLVSGLVAILLSIGAFHLAPPIAEQSAAIVFETIRRVLTQYAEFVKWRHNWKRELQDAVNNRP